MPEHGSTGAGAASAHPAETTPVYDTGPVAHRGPDSLGGLLLILAGIAAAISGCRPGRTASSVCWDWW